MKWTKITPEVTETDSVWTLPYIQGSPHVEMFGTPDYYTSIEFALAVNKDFTGIYPFWRLPFTFDEMVFFLCDDWSSWRGQEVGFRFPLHVGRNWVTIYMQYGIPWMPWFEVPLYVPNLREFHEYRIDLSTWSMFRSATFRIDGRVVMWYAMVDNGKPFLPVLTCHTRYGDLGYWMKMKETGKTTPKNFEQRPYPLPTKNALS